MWNVSSWRRTDETGQPLSQEAPLFDDAFHRKLEHLALVSKRILQGRSRAERRSRKVGVGLEFAEHRSYSPGDDFRFIDWNQNARHGRLSVRLFQEEEDITIYLLIDCSASMGFGRPSKLRYAQQLAAALAFVGLANLDRVSLVGLRQGEVACLPPMRGRRQIFKTFSFLQALQAHGGTDLATATRAFTAQHKRRGVAILISDLYDPMGFQHGIDALRYANFEPAVIQVSDPHMDVPDLGDVCLVDAETGAARDISLSREAVARYRRRLAEHQAAVERHCRSKQVPLCVLDTGTACDVAMLRILREGGLVG